MHFTINSGLLAESIAAGVSSVPPKPANPILAGVLVEARHTRVSISSFNYDRATIRTAAADVAEPDDAVVSGRLLALVGSNLPKNAESTVSVTGNEMVISTGPTKFRLPLMHRPDYPDLPVLDATAKVGTVHSETFANAVRVIGAFASTEEKLVNIQALHIVCEPDSLVLSATDRYIIGQRRIEWSGADSAVIDVPAADLTPTIKAVVGAGEDIEILWDGALLGLRTPSATVITRSLAEQFPDINPVIARTRNDPYQCTATVPTAELASMLRRAASIADDKYDQVDLEVTNDALSITTTNSNTGNVADSIFALHHGGNRSLAVNSKRLLSALSIVDDKYVTLAFQSERQSVSLAHMLCIFPGEIEDREELRAPDTDSSALLIGIRK